MDRAPGRCTPTNPASSTYAVPVVSSRRLLHTAAEAVLHDDRMGVLMHAVVQRLRSWSASRSILSSCFGHTLAVNLQLLGVMLLFAAIDCPVFHPVSPRLLVLGRSFNCSSYPLSTSSLSSSSSSSSSRTILRRTSFSKRSQTKRHCMMPYE